MNIENYLAHFRLKIDQALDTFLCSKKKAHPKLYKAAHYALIEGGKRLRPLLTLATMESLGSDPEKGIMPACAIEMIHAYSLIHDDLPCMDNDDFRRGRPTVHRAFSESIAVLTGDFLLTSAFEILSKNSKLNSKEKLSLISLLTEASGGFGMIGGQVHDMESLNQDLSEEAILSIYQKKTGALLTCSLLFGGVLAKVKAKEMKLLKKCGENLGLGFQIVDDIIDITSPKEKHGGLQSSDLKNQKITFVSKVGLPSAKKLAKDLLDSALEDLKEISSSQGPLSLMAKYLIERKL